MTDIVDRLREKIIADAFEQRRIVDGKLCERLMDERADAADEIERLRAGGCARNQGLTQYCAEVADAVLAEREACARIADAIAERRAIFAGEVTGYDVSADDCKDIAAAIRARTVAGKPLTAVAQIT